MPPTDPAEDTGSQTPPRDPTEDSGGFSLDLGLDDTGQNVPPPGALDDSAELDLPPIFLNEQGVEAEDTSATLPSTSHSRIATASTAVIFLAPGTDRLTRHHFSSSSTAIPSALNPDIPPGRTPRYEGIYDSVPSPAVSSENPDVLVEAGAEAGDGCGGNDGVGAAAPVCSPSPEKIARPPTWR